MTSPGRLARPVPVVGRTTNRWRIFLIALSAILAPMLLWALASPMMSIPDEASHAIRAAAVVRGQIASVPWDKHPELARAEVPRYVARGKALTCYAFHPEIAPDCITPNVLNQLDIVTTGSSAGLNSPAYYAIVGLPTLVISGTPALYGMRAMNAILCAAALAVMFMQLMQLPRYRWTLLASWVAITPMVLYLGGSINPNGVELASAGALFATLVVTVQSTASRWVVRERAALIVVSAALLISTRSIALLWVLIIVGAALIFSDSRVLRGLLRRPTMWVALIATGAFAAATVLWYLTPAKFAQEPTAGFGTTPVTEFFTMIFRTFDFTDGLIGFFGWVDTPSPVFSVIVWSFGILSLLLAAAAWGSVRGRIVVLVLTAMMVLVPAIAQTILITTVGNIWQGRYMLAMFLCLMVACGLAIDDSDRAPHLSGGLRRFLSIAIVLLSIGQVFSFVSTLRRYVVTINGGLEEMFGATKWQPPLGWFTLTMLLIFVVAAAALLLRRAVFPPEPEMIEPGQPSRHRATIRRPRRTRVSSK